MSYARELYLKSLMDKSESGGLVGPAGPAGRAGPAGQAGPVGPAGPAGPAGQDGRDGKDGQDGQDGRDGPTGPTGSGNSDGSTTDLTTLISSTGPTGSVGPTGPAGPGSADGTIISLTGPTGPAGSGSSDGSGMYANDTWLLNNLIGQAPAFSFGKPISKTTSIYIPWTYPKQTRWTSTQLLPNITNFTQYIEPSSDPNNKVYIADQATGNWIKTTTTDPSFVLVINKNSTTTGFSNITYTDSSGISYSAYAYSYYNASLSSKLGNETAKNTITGWYSNPSEFGTTNKTNLTFGGFLSAGAPSQPTIISITSANVNSLTVNWNAPSTPDTTTGQGQIVSYDISYNSIGSSIRYPSAYAHPNLFSSNGITPLNKQITGLYPDSSYSFQILATNDSGGKGPYSSIFSGSTTNLTPTINPLSGVSFNVSSYSNGTIYYISDTSNRTGTQISNPLLKYVDITTNITVPIHRVNNRGKLGTGTTLMNLSSKLNNNAVASVNYTGFPITIPNVASVGFVTITTNSISDNYTNAYDQGFYLNANSTITVKKEGFLVGKTLNTISCSQIFTNNSGSDSIANYSFYYDDPITTVPSGTINTITIPNTTNNFKQVSGINVLQGAPTISVDTTSNNMGNYFYSSPLISYTCTIGSVNTPLTETTLANAQSTDIASNGTIINGKLNFKNSITSNPLSSTFSKTVQVNATANNIHGPGTLTNKSINVITDGPSCAFVYSTLAQSIQTLIKGSSSTGFRIWTAPSVSNNCPELSANYKDIIYNNSWNITSTNNGGYDATRELQIYNGLFCTPSATSSNAYIDYSSYLYNSLNYSSLSNETGYRFVSFCWKLPQSDSSFKTLSFTINSISPAPIITDGYLFINGQKTQILYCFQDAAINTYSQANFNSVWINANNNVNTVATASYSNTTNKYGFYSAGKGASTSGNNATINAFIPAVNPVPNSVYLYLRIVVPMNLFISFGAVTAIVT